MPKTWYKSELNTSRRQHNTDIWPPWPPSMHHVDCVWIVCVCVRRQREQCVCLFLCVCVYVCVRGLLGRASDGCRFCNRKRELLWLTVLAAPSIMYAYTCLRTHTHLTGAYHFQVSRHKPGLYLQGDIMPHPVYLSLSLSLSSSDCYFAYLSKSPFASNHSSPHRP